MEETIHLAIPRGFVGQIVDGLEVLIEQWEATAKFLESGYMDGDVCIRECTDEREAKKIAAHYREILELVVGQLRESAQGIKRRSG